MNDKVKEALIGWLQDLERLNLFSKTENPPLKNLIQPGRISILDLSEIISAKKKQIIVGYLADKLFYNRRMGAIPPFVMIIEEAHQFAPEGISSELSISKNAIETIAREGVNFLHKLD
jgi:DNA helicase HerA-like ATPase